MCSRPLLPKAPSKGDGLEPTSRRALPKQRLKAHWPGLVPNCSTLSDVFGVLVVRGNISAILSSLTEWPGIGRFVRLLVTSCLFQGWVFHGMPHGPLVLTPSCVPSGAWTSKNPFGCLQWFQGGVWKRKRESNHPEGRRKAPKNAGRFGFAKH